MGKPKAATAPANRLVKALDADYQYRGGETLRWMLSKALHLVGLPEWEPIPEPARELVDTALHIYEEEVAQAEPFTDILGATYMALVSSWGQSVLGQYFTPEPVAMMMAMITLGDAKPDDDGKLITACDPAVGSGVMMLSFLKAVMKRDGREALRRYSVTGIDRDPVCARMFSLQMLANCAIHKLEIGEIVAYCGNSLGDPKELQVLLHASAPNRPVVAPANHPARLAAIADAAARTDFHQVPLFEELQEAA